jgi:ubiquinone/menaquinone biosynthesis C-methylase UbiE
MTTTEAASLIKPGIDANDKPSAWADLGCGSGTFTKALATCLGVGSKIYAIDKEHQTIKVNDDIAIQFFKLDFVEDELPLSDLDGILMANSLHYVKEKTKFLDKIKQMLKPYGQMVIVEYDTKIANQWVPYPMHYLSLVETFSKAGFTHIKKIGERNSVYNGQKMYACSVKR